MGRGEVFGRHRETPGSLLDLGERGRKFRTWYVGCQTWTTWRTSGVDWGVEVGLDSYREEG